MPADRPNINLAAAVDHALTMRDVRAAAAFLVDHRAGFALICRVLKDPARRRETCRTGQVAGLTGAKLP